MTKKSLRLALWTSVMSMILCAGVFVASSYAWFTDSATSSNNKITVGNLDVNLYHTNKTVTRQQVDETTVLFDSENFLWEPGAMQFETFTVKNEGSLNLKYDLELNVTPGEPDLTAALRYAVLMELLPSAPQPGISSLSL